MCALSVTSRGRFILCTNPRAANRPRKAYAAYSMPRSVWKISPGRGAPMVDGVVERGQRQPGIPVAAHAPPHDPPRVAIHHHGQIAPRRADLQIRDVPHPHLVWARGHTSELAVRHAREERVQHMMFFSYQRGSLARISAL